MRAKFRCNSVTDTGSQVQASLNAVADDGTPENERYHKYTPSGALTITIDNPDLGDFFVPQGFYYLDFSPAAP